MRVPSAPRRTGARTKPVHFTYVGVERGQPTEAYIAGPTWWGYLHMSKPSKPCVYEVTGGKIECRFCRAGRHRVAVMKGWVPLYRRVDTLAWMVPVDEGQRDRIDALDTFTKVMVGRGGGKGVGVWVQPCTNQEPAWSCTLPERSTAADVTESLLTVWAVPEVLAFFGRASDTAVSLTHAATPDGGETPPAQDAPPAVRPYTPTEGDGAAQAADYTATVNRIKERVGALKPSANGRHDKT